MTKLDLPTTYRAAIGFERIFDELERQFANTQASGNYPPYNIVEISKNEWEISIAVAGLTMDNLSVVLDKNILTIEGFAPKPDEDTKYLYKGIAGRAFRRDFTLADHVEVKEASLELGILTIRLARNIPEELQPKKIAINTKK